MPEVCSKQPDSINEASKPSMVSDTGNHFTPWLLEAASLLLSVICTMAVLIILRIYDNQPLPDALYGLTLNSIISILSDISHAALVYPVAEAISQLKWVWFWDPKRSRLLDDFEVYNRASRGPVGCFTLLVKPRLWHVSTIGAFLTIAAVMMQTFLQLMPAYVPQAMISDKTATVRRSTGFAMNIDDRFDIDFDAGLYGALYTGIFSNNETPSMVIPTCATANCSWPSYNSLGICSACEDISYAVKGGVESLWAVDASPGKSRGYKRPGSQAKFLVKAIPLSHTWKRFQNISLAFPLFVYEDLRHNERDVSNSSELQSYLYDCALYWCIRSYSTTMMNGTVREDIVATWPNVTTSTEEVQSGVTFLSTDSNSTSIQPPDFHQEFTAKGVNRIRHFLENTVWGYQLSYSEAYSEIMTQLFQSVLASGGPDWPMESIATSLTAHIRNVGAEEDLAHGLSYTARTYVRVRWKWAILPLTLLALAFVFIAAAALMSAKYRVPTWKSNSLPELVYNLNDAVASKIAACGLRISAMEKASREYNMAITRDNRGLLFAAYAKESAFHDSVASSSRRLWRAAWPRRTTIRERPTRKDLKSAKRAGRHLP